MALLVRKPNNLMSFDAFPKTMDDLKERTLGGAAISMTATCLICILFVSEFRQFRRIETIDKLDVDVSTKQSKIAINLDITLPALPCSEFVLDLIDDSGMQLANLADSLNKLRIDKHGVPMDVPKQIDWGHTLAPAFRHRKVMGLLEAVTSSLKETMGALDSDEAVEERGTDPLTHEEHLAHRRQLAHRALELQRKLESVSSVAQPTAEVASLLHMSHNELLEIKKRIEESQLYSAAQTTHVASNLDSMERNLLKLAGGVDASAASNLQEALRIRLEILQDNLRGFVSPHDIDRRDKYRAMAANVAQLLNSTHLLELQHDERDAAIDTANGLQAALDELAAGAQGEERTLAEARLARNLALLQDSLVGAPLPADYCGSCYGASPDPTACCNTCDEVKVAYRTRRWSMPEEATFEQCRRDARRREATLAEGEGCNVYGSVNVLRSSGLLHLAPASSARVNAAGQPLHSAPVTSHAEVAHFNVSHRINRLSFGDDFPGQVNLLDGAERISAHGPGVARYFLKVVPTIYRDLSGRDLHSNQFASTEYFKPVREDDRLFQVPGIHFAYDITALRVRITEQRGRTFVSFLVRCAATIGGVFTVAGMLDKLLYSSQRLLMKKRELGKAS